MSHVQSSVSKRHISNIINLHWTSDSLGAGGVGATVSALITGAVCDALNEVWGRGTGEAVQVPVLISTV